MGRQSGRAQGRGDGRRAGDGDDPDPLAERFADEAEPGIGDARRSGVRDQGDVLSLFEDVEEEGDLARLLGLIDS